MSDDDVSLTLEEARQMLRCSVATMYRLAEKGRCGAYKLDPDNPRSDWRFRKQAVHEHMRQQAEKR